MRVNLSATPAAYLHMQSGADRTLDVDAARDRNAREALVRAPVLEYRTRRPVGDDCLSRLAIAPIVDLELAVSHALHMRLARDGAAEPNLLLAKSGSGADSLESPASFGARYSRR